jgi:hypothetical protein
MRRGTEDPGVGCIAAQRDRVGHRGRALCALGLPIGLPRHHHVAPAGQRAEFAGQRVPGLAAHDDRMAQRRSLQVRQVFRQVPGQRVVAANHAVGRSRKNQVQSRHADAFAQWGRFEAKRGTGFAGPLLAPP